MKHGANETVSIERGSFLAAKISQLSRPEFQYIPLELLDV